MSWGVPVCRHANQGLCNGCPARKVTMTFKFQSENGCTVETDAKTELAARRKIRRLEKKLSASGIARQRYGKLTRIKKNVG